MKPQQSSRATELRCCHNLQQSCCILSWNLIKLDQASHLACSVVQRLRDQVRDWVDSGQRHLDMDMLLEARRDVEVEMVSNCFHS